MLNAPRQRRSVVPFQRIMVGCITMVALAAGCDRSGSGSLPVPPPMVDGNRAFQSAADFVRLGPKPSGTEECRAAAHWLLRKCRETGFESWIDTWAEERNGERQTYRNVEAILRGAPGAPVLLIASHYDTKMIPAHPDFVGANDSGSSCGLLLELMRTVAQRKPWRGPTLHIAFFDGEECRVAYGPDDGFHGSRHLAARLAREKTVPTYRAMILLDMVGDRDLTLTLPSDTEPDLARRVLRLAEGLRLAKQVGFFLDGTMLDDHVQFQQLGIPAVDLIDFRYGPNHAWWHTPQDTLDKLSADSLAAVGNLTMALIWDLANAPPSQQP